MGGENSLLYSLLEDKILFAPIRPTTFTERSDLSREGISAVAQTHGVLHKTAAISVFTLHMATKFHTVTQK